MKIAGASIGIGAPHRVAPLSAATGPAARIATLFGKKYGEAMRPFSFVQLRLGSLARRAARRRHEPEVYAATPTGPPVIAWPPETPAR
jgi:hypothetical protein